MITLPQAIELAKKAHKGQWRRDKVLTYSQVKKIAGVSTILNKQEFKFNDDSQILWNDLNNKYIYKVPYITHPLAVMDMMTTEEEKIVAVLHDVIEDTDWTFYEESLDKTGLDWQQYLVEPDGTKHKISCVLATRLLQLTHSKNQTYIDYINKLIFNKDKVVIKTKLADICHNLSDNPSNYAKKKYLKTIPILLGAL